LRANPAPPLMNASNIANSTAPLVSVVLPTYNRRAMLMESIASIQAQSEPDWELIVVDDGSSDGTSEWVAEQGRGDDRIRLVRQQNQRLPRALNNGFKQARGEFFTWTSDDNRYLPHAFKVMSDVLRGDARLGLVYAAMNHRFGDRVVARPPKRPEAIWECNKFGGAFMYRASVARSVGEYDPDIRMSEDYDYFLRISYQAPIRYIPEVIYEYSFHEDSLTSRGMRDQVLAGEKMLEKHFRMGKATRNQLSTLATTLSGNARRSGYPVDAYRLALKARSLCASNWKAYKSISLAVGGRLASRFRGTPSAT